MITTDKVPVTTGFRVWKLNGTSIVSGMIIQTNDEWTVKWPDSMEYFWEMPNGEVNMCPDFYTVTYQRERIVRVNHDGGKFWALQTYPKDNGLTVHEQWHEIDAPAEFAYFCNTIKVERAFSGNVYGGVVGIEEWLTFGSVE